LQSTAVDGKQLTQRSCRGRHLSPCLLLHTVCIAQRYEKRHIWVTTVLPGVSPRYNHDRPRSAAVT